MGPTAHDFKQIADHFGVPREMVSDWKKECEQPLFASPPFDLEKISIWLESQETSSRTKTNETSEADNESKKQTTSSPKADTKPPESLWLILLTIVWPLRGWRLVLFIVLLIFAAVAFIWNGLPDKTKLSIIGSLFRVGRSYVGYYPGLEVDELKHVVDLTEWRPIPPEGDEDKAGKVTWDVYFICRRARDDATVLTHYASTSGAEPRVTSQTHDVRLERYANTDRNIRRPQLRRYHVFLNISHEQIDVPFDAHLRTVRFGGFPDPHTEWAAATVLQATRRVTLEVRFPDNKIGSNFQYSAFPRHAKANKRPVTPSATSVEHPAPNVIRWTIEYPRVNYAYRLDWDW